MLEGMGHIEKLFFKESKLVCSDLWRIAREHKRLDMSRQTYLTRTSMSQEVIFKDREVCHRGGDQRGERVITIFCHDNISSPGIFLFESSSLDIAKGLINWKLHSVTRDSRIENDIRVRKLAIHAVECFDKLGTMINIHIFK